MVEANLVTGDAATVAALSMYNSRGVFLALEDLGYVLMSVAFMFAAGGLSSRTPLERTVRWLFMGNDALSVVAVLVCAAAYRADLQDHYEVIAIVLNWLTLIVAGSLLTVVVRRDSSAGALYEGDGHWRCALVPEGRDPGRRGAGRLLRRASSVAAANYRR